MVPTRVIGGRYVLLAELGRGGMGVVWRAEDRVIGRQVAVKELHLPAGLDAEQRRRFRERLLREARLAGRLADPGIVTVHDVVADGGVDHIVMELIEAPTLQEVVERSGPLPEQRVGTIGRQLLSALRTAHERGVVHRDVKPSNVMLAPNGRVTLTDFGIAQAADDPRLTSTGAVIGSPGYLSPERLDGDGGLPPSDLWSLGATLYYALVGSGPFSRETTPATIAAVINAEVPVVRTRGPLGTVVAGLLRRSPEARLTADQAQALLAGAPVTATTAAPGRVAAAPQPPAAPARPRRRRVVLAAVAGLLVGLVAGAVVGLLLPRGGGPAVLTYGAGGDLPVWDLSTTACVQGQLAAGHQFPTSATVGCDSPHDLEVFTAVALMDAQLDEPYPGRAALASVAGPACTLDFDSALVGGADKAALRVTALVPSATAFSARSSPTSSFTDRQAICVLSRADGSQLTGSRVAKG